MRDYLNEVVKIINFSYHGLTFSKLNEINALFAEEFRVIALDIVRNGTVFSSSLFGRSREKTGKVIQSKGGLLSLIIKTNFLFRTVRNLFYPASAFCMIAQKK